MPDLKALYSAATAMPPPVPQPGMGQVDPPAMPREPENINPMTQEGDTFFLDPEMLPVGRKCKQGDELLIRVRVGRPGSKIPITPLEVVDEMESEEGDEMQEEE